VEILVQTDSEPISQAKSEEFFPKGAIAFFVSMLAAFSLIWLGMYFLLVHRQLGL